LIQALTFEEYTDIQPVKTGAQTEFMSRSGTEFSPKEYPDNSIFGSASYKAALTESHISPVDGLGENLPTSRIDLPALTPE